MLNHLSLCKKNVVGGMTGSRRLMSDEQGVVALEMSLIALPLIALLLASVIMSIVYFTQNVLDAVSDSLSRQILTGQAPPSGSAAQFKATACSLLPSYMSCSNLLVNVQSVSSYSDVSTAVPTVTTDASGNVSATTSYDPGTSGSVVVLQLLYSLSVPRSIGGFTAASLENGSRLIISTSVIKVEPSS